MIPRLPDEAVRRPPTAMLAPSAFDSPTTCRLTASERLFQHNRWIAAIRTEQTERPGCANSGRPRTHRPTACCPPRQTRWISGNCATVSTLIQSCKLNDGELLACLANNLQRINSGGTRSHQLHARLPYNWRSRSTTATEWAPLRKPASPPRRPVNLALQWCLSAACLKPINQSDRAVDF